MRWEIKKHDRNAVIALAAEVGVQPLTAAMLISRGYSDPESAYKFLNPAFEHLHDPYLLKGMDSAVARILAAKDRGEKILVWGDYDVDGTTGTVLLRSVFRILGIESEFHIPNRFTEGYGINIPALQAAKERGCSLGISVDCGIRSFEPMEWAAANGLDFIITDHHLSDPERGVPQAAAVVNPNQAGCNYPDKHLAGVGVAFKLAQALLTTVGHEKLIPQFLKIAAIGTVADVMNLSGENRAIVSLGLADIKNTDNFGLKALMEVSDCTSEMTSTHIGFRIAPRINAAGRMDIARHVVELFEANDFSSARKLAGILDSRNRERQKKQQEITELAFSEYADLTSTDFIVVAGDGWHRGVIGLAASRLTEQFYRPSLVLAIDNGIAHGSARSIDGFNVVDALAECSDILEQFGGHSAAAGLQIKSERIDELRERLNSAASKSFAGGEPERVLTIDAPVAASTLNLQLHSELAKLEPFGQGNQKPIFSTKGLVLRGEPFVMKEKHLRLNLIDPDGNRLEAVWWSGVEQLSGRTLKAGDYIELAYSLETNTWQGQTRLQLVVKDLKADN